MVANLAALEKAIETFSSNAFTLKPLHSTDRGQVLSYLLGTGSALKMWTVLREQIEETGYWPLIVDSEFCEKLTELQEQTPLGEDFAVLEDFDTASWFEEAGDDLRADLLDEEWSEDLDGDLLDQTTGCPLGEWPEHPQPFNSFAILDDRHSPNLALLFVPTTKDWEVPIFLCFGGWNECPYPGEIAGLLRHWSEVWRAELVAMTFDTIELRVGRPPKERDAALALAREQYLTCQDIVHQGTNSLVALASGLLGGSTWFFWWD